MLNYDLILSVFVLAGGHGCKGGIMDIAFEYIKKNHGIDTESAYPYTAKVKSV